MRVFFTTTTPNKRAEDHLLPPATVQDLVRDLSGAGHPRFSTVATPDEADAIIFVEPQRLGRLRSYRSLLLRQELIKQYPNKCFTFDYTPEPIGFLPGVYTHMPLRKWDKNRFRAGGYLRTFNCALATYEPQRDREPKYLFSFRGLMSHPVRQMLFDANLSTRETPVEQTTEWGAPTEADKTVYFEQMLDSKFVLCPRGWGTSSIRMYEAMQLGRVPVIIADEWAPPAGPAWNDFSITVAESRIVDIPQIIKAREGDFDAMSSAAREAWECWFSPSVRLVRALENVENLLLTRAATHDESRYRREWTSIGFTWNNGIAIPQSLYGMIRHGVLVQRIKCFLASRFGEKHSQPAPVSVPLR